MRAGDAEEAPPVSESSFRAGPGYYGTSALLEYSTEIKSTLNHGGKKQICRVRLMAKLFLKLQ
jgi:hypothetical protein